MHVAARKGRLEVVKLLLANGADIKIRDLSKETPFHWACEYDRLDVIELLLQLLQQTKRPSADDLDTGLQIALRSGKWRTVQVLMAAGASFREIGDFRLMYDYLLPSDRRLSLLPLGHPASLRCLIPRHDYQSFENTVATPMMDAVTTVALTTFENRRPLLAWYQAAVTGEEQ